MESIQTRRFCYSAMGKKRREYRSIPSLFSAFSFLFFFFFLRRKVSRDLFNYSTTFSFSSSFLISHFSVREHVAVVEYASERRRHKDKSFSHIGTTKRGYRKSRVDFCKSNRPRVGEWPHWNLGNRRGRRNDQQPSHQTIQTRKRESRIFADADPREWNTWSSMEWNDGIFGVLFIMGRMDQGIISLPHSIGQFK